MHLTPYITDPFPAIQTVIASANGSKPKIDGIHAALGLADYGAILMMDKHETTPHNEGVSSLSDSAIAAELESAVPSPPSEGYSAIDWSKLWEKVQPFVIQLLQRWLFSATA